MSDTLGKAAIGNEKLWELVGCGLQCHTLKFPCLQSMEYGHHEKIDQCPLHHLSSTCFLGKAEGIVSLARGSAILIKHH